MAVETLCVTRRSSAKARQPGPVLDAHRMPAELVRLTLRVQEALMKDVASHLCSRAGEVAPQSLREGLRLSRRVASRLQSMGKSLQDISRIAVHPAMVVRPQSVCLLPPAPRLMDGSGKWRCHREIDAPRQDLANSGFLVSTPAVCDRSGGPEAVLLHLGVLGPWRRLPELLRLRRRGLVQIWHDLVRSQALVPLHDMTIQGFDLGHVVDDA
mmetsp:Transcript_47477/g.110284  ORF Transcript_47477/g.110284 Transcript_47477/m.110284 type:complete len:212 (-) Transcript_47477:430-1065(-)